MKNIDIDWLKKIQEKVDNKDRGVKSNSSHSRCEKERFVNRYFKFLAGKCFKLKIKDEIYYALFSSSKVTSTSSSNRKDVYIQHGVRFHCGYNDATYDISFRDEKLQYKQFTLHWNDIIRIKYEEISPEDYFNIIKLFLEVDSD